MVWPGHPVADLCTDVIVERAIPVLFSSVSESFAILPCSFFIEPPGLVQGVGAVDPIGA